MTPPPTSHSTDWSETATTTASSPSSASINSGLLRRGSSSAAVSLCTCQCWEKRVCCVTLRQSTLLTALVSVIFSLLIFAHEIALEGGFNLRNYVVLAFCIVWLIVTALLTLGAYKRAHFLLLPWMILTCLLLPLFIVGIVAGWKVIAMCIRHGTGQSCVHEFHMFGTNDHTSASIKLSILLLIFILNSCCFLVVYRYFVFLTSNENRKRAQQQETGVLDEDHPSATSNPTSSSVRYERFQDEEDPETHVPLCQGADDSRETTT